MNWPGLSGPGPLSCAAHHRGLWPPRPVSFAAGVCHTHRPPTDRPTNPTPTTFRWRAPSPLTSWGRTSATARGCRSTPARRSGTPSTVRAAPRTHSHPARARARPGRCCGAAAGPWQGRRRGRAAAAAGGRRARGRRGFAPSACIEHVPAPMAPVAPPTPLASPGDGMVLSFSFDGSPAVRFKNKFVRTKGFVDEQVGRGRRGGQAVGAEGGRGQGGPGPCQTQYSLGRASDQSRLGRLFVPRTAAGGRPQPRRSWRSPRAGPPGAP